MLKSLPKFLLAAFIFFIFQNVKAQTAEKEPNNTAATANTLSLNGSINGIINPAGDVDWYKVTTTSDGQLNLTSTPLSGKYIWIYLYDHDRTTLLASNNANGTFTVSKDGLAAGTYYVEITTYYSTDTSSYTLSNSLTKIAQANDPEPDSTKALAVTLPVNSAATGHIDYYYNNHRDSADWYKITTTGDGLLKLTLTSYNGQYVWAYLYDNNGVTQLAANNTNSTLDISTDGLAAGTYYVRINTYYNTGFAPYKLADTLYTPKQANDKEPDSTRALALTLAQNSSTTGHVGYYYNNHRDTADWYKVTTTGDGLIKLILTSANGNFVSARLYDNDGATQLAYVEAQNSTQSISTDGLAAGTYYIKLNAYYNNQFVPYVLADSLFTPAQANDKEPDSTKALALTLPLNDSLTGHVDYYYNNHRDSADWYKLILPQDGDLRLRLTSGNGQYVWAYLYDNDGTTQLNANNTNGTLDLVTDGLGAGTYYVRINTYYNNGYVPYKIADSLFLYNSPNDTITNEYFSQAPTILSNRVTGGHVGFYYNKMRDTTDNFKINYTGTSGNLNLTFRLEPHISDGSVNYTWFQVYKDTTASPIYSNNFNSTLTQVNLTGLSQGYYYIRVFEYYNSQSQAYSIADSFVQVNIAKISINTSKTLLNGSCGTDSITYNLSASHSPYTVRLYKNSTLYDSSITTSATIIFKGLSAGSYYATVYGDGATDEAYGKSATSTITPPVPTALSTSDIGVHTATLNWTKISCANYYTVQYRIVGTQTWTIINTKGDTSKLALTGLQPYTLYVWEVASADTAKGSTFMSAYDSLRFTTLSDTAHIALVVKGAGSTCNSDTLKYKSTNSAAPYTITLYRNGTVYGSPLSVTDTASFYNVPPGNYYAKSTGTGSGGSFGLSDTTQIVPPAPTGLDTTGVTTTMATLNWDPVSCANYYVVEYLVTGTTTWTMVSSGTNSVILNNLAPDTKYTWRVSALDSFNKQTVTGVYSNTATFKTESILPVTFISFNATLQNNEALLTWTTAEELNNKGFEVEKSYDGQTFSDLAFINGKGNSSSLNNYSYTDVKVVSGSDYYRLKQIDLDGNFSYSSTIKIDYSKFDWSILGNPSSGNTWLQLQLDKQAHVAVQIISVSGKAIQLIDKGNLNAGTYSIPLNLNNATAGMYIVKLFVDNNNYSKKIIK